MHRTTTLLAFVAAAALTLGASACEFDVPDLNNPGLDDLQDHPTATVVNAATTGLLFGHRSNLAAANGYVAQLGIMGREAYNFDDADPRFIGELLTGALNPGSPFGGNFWPLPYANLRQAQIILDAKGKVAEFSTEEQKGIEGFVDTIMALDLLIIANTRDTNGGVIDMTRTPADGVAPLVSKDAMFEAIVKHLDDGKAALMMAGDAFSFPLSTGFRTFDSPATFLTFNRALRARVAIYLKDYQGALDALAESFIVTMDLNVQALQVGCYESYSTASGDAVNALINPNIFAHPNLVTAAQKKANNDPDDRLTRKVVQVPDDEVGGASGISSNVKFTIYGPPDNPNPAAFVSIIRNEELILLRAEANWGLGGVDNLLAAVDDLNLVRTISGGLPALAPGQTADQIEDEILYNRRYSLLFEGGHRWLDLRRFDRLTDLAAEDPNIPDDPATPDNEHITFVYNVRYPIPRDECNGRPATEARCKLGSM